jgi:hypothetical protein
MVSREQIATASLQFKNQTAVEVTPAAQDLIRVVLSSVEDDPHPRWMASAGDRAAIVKRLLADLPDYLGRIVTAEETKTLTTFHVLHWLAVNLDRICPIEKT